MKHILILTVCLGLLGSCENDRQDAKYALETYMTFVWWEDMCWAVSRKIGATYADALAIVPDRLCRNHTTGGE